MKVSPLEAKNKYGVLEIEETPESGPRPIDPLIVTYYAINFISKLHRRDMYANYGYNPHMGFEP